MNEWKKYLTDEENRDRILIENEREDLRQHIKHLTHMRSKYVWMGTARAARAKKALAKRSIDE